MSVFNGKVIIITGASEGIGRALCLELAKQKANIVIAARNEQRLHQLREEIKKLGASALAVPCDLTIEAECKRLIDTCVTEYDRIDVLINNAGRTMWTTFEEIKDTSIFKDLMQINYFGSVYCTYYALPHLKNSKGRIVAVSSLAGISGVPSRTAYAASKHAMFGFFDSLRIELSDTGVTVTIVAPDFVLSEIHRRAVDGNGNPLNKSPMQESKIMTSEECAVMIVKAMEKRDRLMITTLRGRLARWMKLVDPVLTDKMAARAIQERK